jgi:hypothetical protein
MFKNFFPLFRGRKGIVVGIEMEEKESHGTNLCDSVELLGSNYLDDNYREVKRLL